MTTRVTLDGVPNEPLAHADWRTLVEPILVALGGLDVSDVESITLNGRKVSAKVAIRTKRGRRLVDSWAHVSRLVDYPDVEES